jgi:hypothetical protein
VPSVILPNVIIPSVTVSLCQVFYAECLGAVLRVGPKSSYHCGSFEKVGGKIWGNKVCHPVAELGEIFVAVIRRRRRREALAVPGRRPGSNVISILPF